MTEDWHRTASCTGKMAFKSKGAALRAISARQKAASCARSPNKDRKRSLAKLHAYRCGSCSQFHVGNSETVRGRRI